MKRIGLFLTASPWGGGMYQYSTAVLSGLLALPRTEYAIVAAYDDPAWERSLPVDVERYLLRFSRTLTSVAKTWVLLGCSHRLWLRHAPSLSQTVRDIVGQNCDLWIFPRQDLWSSRFPVRSLGAIHDLMHRYEPHFSESAGFARQRYRDNYLSDLSRCAAGILVDSKVGLQHVCESYGPDPAKVFVLPYIPPPYIFAGSVSKDFDARYRLPEKFLFYPAQFWPHKNHIGLLNALGQAREQASDIHIVLTGRRKGKEYARLLSHVGKLQLQDRVRCVGDVPDQDIPEFYRRARALILPTFFGPTNIPPLEAFALGCPVAVSRIYGMPEQVGDAALLFDPHSEAEMADCMLRLWNDDQVCRDLSLAGRERARAWGKPEFAAALYSLVKRLTASSETNDAVLAQGTGLVATAP